MDMEWAAGIFIGEGSAGVCKRPSGKSGTREYVVAQINMLDIRAMTRFAETVEMVPQLSVKPYPLDPTRQVARLAVTHLLGGRLLNLLLPHMRDTDKGDQAIRALVQCGWRELPSGLYAPPAKAYNGVPGNQNAKGKTWKLSEETRARMSAARRRREESRRG